MSIPNTTNPFSYHGELLQENEPKAQRPHSTPIPKKSFKQTELRVEAIKGAFSEKNKEDTPRTKNIKELKDNFERLTERTEQLEKNNTFLAVYANSLQQQNEDLRQQMYALTNRVDGLTAEAQHDPSQRPIPEGMYL